MVSKNVHYFFNCIFALSRRLGLALSLSLAFGVTIIKSKQELFKKNKQSIFCTAHIYLRTVHKGWRQLKDISRFVGHVNGRVAKNRVQ